MVRIGLISDTHGVFDQPLINFLKDVDEIWHAGDFGNIKVSDAISSFKPLKAVYGNCDGTEVRIVHPFSQIMEIEGLRFLMTHVGGYPKHYSPEALDLFEKHQPNVFICGHSHILKVMNDKQHGFILINPGAAGIYGIHTVRTALKFIIENGSLHDLEVGEWPKHTII